uniref:Uncharacterized protein n=1 Tax=Sphaerodactylus townsendi TaxID=933632 RepID=A0ACB8FT58_9SAUR
MIPFSSARALPNKTVAPTKGRSDLRAILGPLWRVAPEEIPPMWNFSVERKIGSRVGSGIFLNIYCRFSEQESVYRKASNKTKKHICAFVRCLVTPQLSAHVKGLTAEKKQKLHFVLLHKT